MIAPHMGNNLFSKQGSILLHVRGNARRVTHAMR